MVELGDVIERNYLEYGDFMSSLKHPVKHCADFLSRCYSEEHSLNNISHMADADGLASLLINDIGFKIMKDYMGLNESPRINSLRIMGFSENEKSQDHPANIASKMGEGLYLISDIGTFGDSCVEFFHNVINIDHHISTSNISTPLNINPHDYGIDGGLEISGSVASFLFLNRLFDELKDSEGCIDTRIASNNKKKQNLIDFLGIVALSGADADMQGPCGLNKSIYDYLEKRNIIQHVDSPFYGYSTKPLYKVVSESSIPFNLKYGIKGTVPDDFCFTDDVKGSQRDGLAKQFLFNSGFKDVSLPLMYHSKEMQQRLRHLFSENISKYCDENIREVSLAQLKQGQHIVSTDKYLFGGLSISEVGNMLTALSKLDFSEEIHAAIETYFFSQDRNRDTILESCKNKINQIHKEYKSVVSEGMNVCEGLMSNGLRNICDDVFYLNLNNLNGITSDVRLRKLTGVFGGIITKNRMLPGDYGVLFTSYGNGDYVKISARVSEHNKYGDLDLGKFMNHFGGGGHKMAASCYILKSNLVSFFEKAENYLGDLNG